MSTIVNSAGRFAGFSGVTTQKLNTALSGASQVDTSLAIPATSAGYVRVKITNGGGANTAVVYTVTMTDGTATIMIDTVNTAYVIANQANSGLDMLLQYNLDIHATTCHVLATLSGTTTTANLDFEVI